MSVGEPEVAAPQTLLPKIWMWVDDRWPSVEFVGRFFKYSFLVVALALTTGVVFDGYSYYVMRRNINVQLAAAHHPSLEYLDLLQQRERVLIGETLNNRCTERLEIALFRLFKSNEEIELAEFHKKTMDVRHPLATEIAKMGDRFLEDAKKVRDFIDEPTFSVEGFKKIYRKKTTVSDTNAEYVDFNSQVNMHLQAYLDLVSNNSDLKKLAQNVQGEHKSLLHMKAINILEDRIYRLNNERAKILKNSDLQEIMAQYAAWTNALIPGQLAKNTQFEEMFMLAEKEVKDNLSSLNCQKLKEYNPVDFTRLELQVAAEIENKSKEAKQEKLIPWYSAAFHFVFYGPRDGFWIWYDGEKLAYFKKPPAAQTLFVTLFLGALGELTVNVLRLSQLGWWRDEKDPAWGEIVVSPMLGALAALAIYLVVGAGLLLTSDFRAAQTSTSTLSASFIGLLGFLSGFLYDVAFGRVRRVGLQLFEGPATPSEARGASEEDRSLAEVLKSNGASRMASLVLSFRPGPKLARETEFTLLVPSDSAMGRMPLDKWSKITDKEGIGFEKWYKAHHAAKKITTKELENNNKLLKLEDGTSVEMKLAGNELNVNSIKAAKPDIEWKNGVIHILLGDFDETPAPPAAGSSKPA